MPLPVLLATDVFLWVLVAAAIALGLRASRMPTSAAKWSRVFSRPSAQASFVILAFFLALALADSIHFRVKLQDAPSGPVYSAETVSLVDFTLGRVTAGRERSYSKPFATHEFDKTSVMRGADSVRARVHLEGAARGVANSRERNRDVAVRLAAGAAAVPALLALIVLATGGAAPGGMARGIRAFAARRPGFAASIAVIAAAVCVLAALWGNYHPLGTDKTGNDVLLQAVKSLRTAFVLGTLATMSMLPFAVVLGIAAGYLKGRADDVIQYIYTTISSIPSVLLIAAAALMIQVFIDSSPELLPTSLERADAKLLFIAVIIGVTGWAGLARLLRAETLKISSLDYIAAARSCGVPARRIMARHIFPNVLHIILIVSVIGFSDIVLYEAVLAYIGVGVDPSMNSFGSMINAARNEMSRTPAVWWNLLAAFLFMVTMVLAANLFASAVRDAFDPRSKKEGGK